jgi:hypothetical protein
MGGGSEALLEVWRALLDLFSESFEYKKKIELVQISAPGESIFKQD